MRKNNMFEIRFEKLLANMKIKKKCFPYDLWILRRKGFNYLWNLYFVRISYFPRRLVM
jgi:hypothetical protein